MDSGSQPESAPGPGVRLACPKCGAELVLHGAQAATRCDHCGTAHLVVGRTEILTLALPDRVADGTDAEQAFLADLQTRHLGELSVDRRPVVDPDDPLRSNLLSRLLSHLLGGAGEDGRSLPEAVHAADAREWAAELARRTEPVTHQRLLAPYWHLSGRLYETLVGRDARGDKLVAGATKEVELSAPAFAPDLPLPPLGRLSSLRALAPVSAAELAARPTLDLAGGPEVLEGRVHRAARQRLVQHLDPLLRHALVWPRQRHLLLRPLHLLTVRCRGRVIHVLIEGASRRVLARLTAAAAEHLRGAPSSALPVELASSLDLRPMRCPQCAWELPLERHDELRFCRGCGRAVRVEGQRAGTLPYLVEAEPGAGRPFTLLPFWRFGFRLAAAGQEQIARSVREVLAFLGGGQGGADTPESIDVPAFRPFDRYGSVVLCQPLFALAGTRGMPPVEGPVRGAQGFPFPERGVTVSAEEAAHLARTALLLGLSPALLLQAPTASLRRTLLDSRLELERPRLVLRRFRPLDVTPLLGPAPQW